MLSKETLIVLFFWRTRHEDIFINPGLGLATLLLYAGLRRQIRLLRFAILLFVAGEILRQHWYGPVTRQAHLRIFSCQAFGIETRPVWVEPPTANRRVAG